MQKEWKVSELKLVDYCGKGNAVILNLADNAVEIRPCILYTLEKADLHLSDHHPRILFNVAASNKADDVDSSAFGADDPLAAYDIDVTAEGEAIATYLKLLEEQ